MRAFILHNRTSGNIDGLAICPPDGPPLLLEASPSQTVTEIELPEDTFELDNEQQIIESLKSLRVDVKTEAKLVRK